MASLLWATYTALIFFFSFLVLRRLSMQPFTWAPLENLACTLGPRWRREGCEYLMKGLKGYLVLMSFLLSWFRVICGARANPFRSFGVRRFSGFGCYFLDFCFAWFMGRTGACDSCRFRYVELPPAGGSSLGDRQGNTVTWLTLTLSWVSWVGFFAGWSVWVLRCHPRRLASLTGVLLRGRVHHG